MTKTATSIAIKPTGDVRDSSWLQEDTTASETSNLNLQGPNAKSQAIAIDQLTSIEMHLEAGLLNIASLMLNGKRTAWVSTLRYDELDARIMAARKRLEESCAFEACHGKGSAYVPEHKLSVYTLASEIMRQEIQAQLQP